MTLRWSTRMAWTAGGCEFGFDKGLGRATPSPVNRQSNVLEGTGFPMHRQPLNCEPFDAGRPRQCHLLHPIQDASTVTACLVPNIPSGNNRVCGGRWYNDVVRATARRRRDVTQCAWNMSYFICCTFAKALDFGVWNVLTATVCFYFGLCWRLSPRCFLVEHASRIFLPLMRGSI